MRTPGKWHVRTTYNGRSITKSYWIAPEGPEPGTEALAKLMRHNRNRIDDANLMAAAPELLDVAKRAVDYYCSEYCGGPPHNEQCKEFHGVIAKAEGKS